MSYHRSSRVPALLLLAGSVLLAQSLLAEDPKPAKPTVALLTGGAAEDLKVLRETLGKVSGIKFKADEIQFADFGRDGGMFTKFFTLEITDLSKTDLGAIARAVAEAKTSKKDRTPSALYVIFRYRPGSAKNETLRAALAKVKGVQADKSWVGDSNIWVRVDGSDRVKLAEITRALHGADIKFRDPITDTDRP